jgi:DNA-binding Xre family transcriptional regulator
MKIEKINIGLIIEQKMNELSVSKSELSRRIGVANQNINRILGKPSIDTDKLIAISEALNYNFFHEYVDDAQSAPTAETQPTNKVETHGPLSPASLNGDVSLDVGGAEAVLVERVKYLERIVEEKERLIKVLMKEGV